MERSARATIVAGAAGVLLPASTATRWTRLAAVVLGAVALGCSTAIETVAPSASGTFTGTTADGRPVVLAIEQRGQAVSGGGRVGDKPIVLAGPLTWHAVGSLVRDDGSVAPVRLELSADGQALVVDGLSGQDLVLERGGELPQMPGGPFSGAYRAVQDGRVLGEMTIVQRGSLVSGVGVVLGEPAGIGGRVTAPDRARGVVTFADQSQVTFDAELEAGGAGVVLRGFGAPVRLQRRWR